MAATTHNTPYRELTDEHSVLLWQTCAYADELVDTARSRRPLNPAFDTMLDFLHHRLLPYLSAEERQLSGSELRDEHFTQVLLTDHNRIRAGVENVEAARTRLMVTTSTAALVSRLDRHVQREETWVTDTDLHQRATEGAAAPAAWALPLLLAAEIDLDALPHDTCDRLVLTRLQRDASRQDRAAARRPRPAPALAASARPHPRRPRLGLRAGRTKPMGSPDHPTRSRFRLVGSPSPCRQMLTGAGR